MIETSTTKKVRGELARLEVDPNFMSTADAAEALGLSPKQLWRLIEKGTVGRPTCPIPRRCFVPRRDVERMAHESGHELSARTEDYFLTRRGAAARLRVCIETVSRMVKDGRLSEPVVKGGRWYFHAGDVTALHRKRVYEALWGMREIQAQTGLSDRQFRLLRRNKMPLQVRDLVWHRGDIIAWWESINGDPEAAYPEIAGLFRAAARY